MEGAGVVGAVVVVVVVVEVVVAIVVPLCIFLPPRDILLLQCFFGMPKNYDFLQKGNILIM